MSSPGSSSPFSLQPLRRPALWRRLFRRVKARQSVAALNNVLARARRPSQVTEKEVARALKGYPCDPRVRFPEAAADLYRAYLLWCVGDRRLDTAEIDELLHLKRLLRLNDTVVDRIFVQVVGKVYEGAVAEVMADAKVDSTERSLLQALRARLSLSPEIADKIYQQQGKDWLDSRLDQALSDDRLSPDEEEELGEIARSLDLEVELDSATREKLVRCRMFWVVENRELPRTVADIPLDPGEVCHLALQARWFHDRPVARAGRREPGPVRERRARERYWRCRDVYWSKERERQAPTRVDLAGADDGGRVYVTDRRVVLVGSKRRETIRLDEILEMDPAENGVAVQRRSGSRPFIGFGKGAEVFALVLERLVRESESMSRSDGPASGEAISDPARTPGGSR